MEISNLETKKEYRLMRAYGQSSQKVKVLSVDANKENATVKYTSDNHTKGLITEMNEIECRRYLRELN
jgi:hypothetical protein